MTIAVGASQYGDAIVKVAPAQRIHLNTAVTALKSGGRAGRLALHTNHGHLII